MNRHLLDRRGATLCGAPSTPASDDAPACRECQSVARDHPFLALSAEDARAFVQQLAETLQG